MDPKKLSNQKKKSVVGEAKAMRGGRCSSIFFSCLGDTEHFLCLKSAKNKSEFFFFRFRKQQGGNSLNI
ncbi:hypothetical protein LWI28_002125 [Acer negundo]|uniref:Uncharacterized protein n=1 Tax=Acer negundo TaxID=4023 RepID=A0AAD5NTI5_ACENE|nr:hypothetical protein LWI28_002125 [Acer negundo]